MIPGARLVVLGKQGAGKGTQCVRLSHHYVIPHIATGDMMRAHVKLRTPVGDEVRRFMDDGELIPDEIMLRMVRQRLEQDDTKTRGFVLDGFPRTREQARGLDEILTPAELDLVINLDVPRSVVMTRLAGRRVCEDCGTIYSVDSPPRTRWICDVCGGEVIQREDDTEAAIRRRLDLYEAATTPLIEWYTEAGKLVTVDGTGDPDTVFDRLVDVVDKYRGDGGFGPPLRAVEPHVVLSHEEPVESMHSDLGAADGERPGDWGAV